MLLLGLMLFVQLPGVQTRVARYVTSRLEGVIDARLEIGSIGIHPFNAVIIRHAVLIDKAPYSEDKFKRGFAPVDTIAYIGKLTATVSPLSFFKKGGVRLLKVSADSILFHLAIEPDTLYPCNIARILRADPAKAKPPGPDSLFHIHRVEVTNARYRMQNFAKEPAPWSGGLNYEDMDIRFDVRGHNVGFADGKCYSTVTALSLRDKNGFGFRDLRGSCTVGRGHVYSDGLDIDDLCGSRLEFSRVDLSYDDGKDWADFVNKVCIEAVFKPSKLVFSTVGGYSTGVFWGCPFTMDISAGRFIGPISSFEVQGLSFKSPEGLSGTIDYSCEGLPDINVTRMGATVRDFRFTTAGLETALNKFVKKPLHLRGFAPGEELTFDAVAGGPMSDLRMDATIAVRNGGSLHTEVSVTGLLKENTPLQAGADISTTGLDIGGIIATEEPGPCSLEATASCIFRPGSSSINLSSLKISQCEALGYVYHDISAAGNFTDGRLNACINSPDPAARFSIDAELDFNGECGRADINLDHIDLERMNIDRRGGASLLSCSISGEKGELSGSPATMVISGLDLTNNEGTHQIGDIKIEARTGESWALILNSDCLDAKYDGTSKIEVLPSVVKYLTAGSFLPSLLRSGAREEVPPPGAFTAGVTFHDASGLLSFLMPGMKIEEGSSVSLDIDGEGRLLGYISTPDARYGGIRMNGASLALDNVGGDLSLTLNADQLRLGRQQFLNPMLSAEAAGDRLDVRLNYDEAPGLGKASELAFSSEFSRDERDSLTVRVSTLPSQISFKDKLWEMDPSEMELRSERIRVSDFKLRCEGESIALDGGVSDRVKDTLDLRLSKLGVGIINEFTAADFPVIDGVIDGSAVLFSPVAGGIAANAALLLDSFTVDGSDAGSFKLTSDWDDSRRRLNARLTNTVGEAVALKVNGHYDLKGKGKTAYEASASFDRFALKVAEPMLHGILSDMGGFLNGSLKFSGSGASLKAVSEGLQLDGARFRVVPTQVAYTLNGSLGLDGSRLIFNNIGIGDDYGGLGVLKGNLNFGNLSKAMLDASIDMHKLRALDVKDRGSNDGVYGELALDGKASIKGPFNALALNADISTAGEGSVHVPTNSSASAAVSDLLTFVEPEPADDDEPVQSARSARAKSPQGSFSAHARLNISPDITAMVEIDKSSGHTLSASGGGDITFDLNSGGDALKLNGDYVISKGKYKFTIPGIVSKDFDIREGSSLNFNGPVEETALDIQARYNVKTSLSTIVSDSTSVSSRRNVICGLNIGGKVKAPEVNFSIEVPDLDPNSRMQVDAALNTEDKVQKQFVALLLFATFLPEEGAGVVNGTNMLISNVGEVVSSQLNNILQKLDIPLDFGLGYQQGNAGNDIFDVAVSTQLFNNRVLVNGSVGNRLYSTSKTAGGDVVGDLDIEIKLDKSGETRFKLFSHSADEHTSSLDFSQRNGLGVSYQKEFNHMRDFFREMFMSRRRKEREKLLRQQNKTMKTIEIE